MTERYFEKYLWGVSLLLLTSWFIYLVAPILSPFVVGAGLAYLTDPWVDKLERYKLPRTLGVLLIFVLGICVSVMVLLWVMPQIAAQCQALASQLPDFFVWVQDIALPWVSTTLGVNLPAIDMGTWQEALMTYWREAGSIAGDISSHLFHSTRVFFSWWASLGLVAIVTFYLLRDWDRLLSHCRQYIPKRYEHTMVHLCIECDEVLGAFIRGQLFVMLALAVIYAVGLHIVGLKFALLIGLLAGLLSFIPYLGTAVGILVSLIAVQWQLQDWVPMIHVLIVFGIGQLLEAVVLTPYLVGDSIGLHPVMVIFALLVGGQLFGFVGLLLALPCAAVLMVWQRHFCRQYIRSDFYRRGA